MNPKLYAMLAAALALSGCASVLNGVMQPVTVRTVTQDGVPVTGARCVLRNDHGEVHGVSGEVVMVHRSAADLHVVCHHADHPDALAEAVSRGTQALSGNLIAGGGLGALVDLARGSAYAYPARLDLVFGRAEMADARERGRRVTVSRYTPPAQRN